MDLENKGAEISARNEKYLRHLQGLVQILSVSSVNDEHTDWSRFDELHQYLTDILITVEDLHWIIVTVSFMRNDFIGTHTENKCIFFADFLYDLNICTIHRSERQRTV